MLPTFLYRHISHDIYSKSLAELLDIAPRIVIEASMSLLLHLIQAPATDNNHKLTTIFFALTPFFATTNASSMPSRPFPAT